RAGGRDTGPSGEVPAQVVDLDAGLGLGDAHGLEGLLHADGRTGLGAQLAAGAIDGGGPAPGGVVEAEPIPAVGLAARIEVLAAVDAGEDDGAVGSAPGGGGPDVRCGAVGVLEMQLRAQAGLAEGAGVFGVAAAGDIIEAVAEQEADGVGAGSEEI